MTGGREPVRGQERLARSAGLAVRALLIAFLGLMLGEIGSGLAVILTYYGVLFLLGLPFLGLRAPALLDARGGLGGGRAAAQHRDPGTAAHPRHRQPCLRPGRRARTAARRAAVHRLLPGAAVAGVPPGRHGAGSPRPAAAAGSRSAIAAIGGGRGRGRDVALARPHRPAAASGQPCSPTPRARRAPTSCCARSSTACSARPRATARGPGCSSSRPHSSTPVRPRPDDRQRLPRARHLPARRGCAAGLLAALRAGVLRRRRDDADALHPPRHDAHAGRLPHRDAGRLRLARARSCSGSARRTPPCVARGRSSSWSGWPRTRRPVPCAGRTSVGPDLPA